MYQPLRLRLIQSFALVAFVASLYLYVLPPDVERFLQRSLPGHHKPDAFEGLNGKMSLFMMIFVAMLLVALRIERKHQHELTIPLLSGPTICFVGWSVTENFNDPNWVMLFCLIIIGMFVSCLVTAILLMLVKNKTGRNDQNEVLDRH